MTTTKLENQLSEQLVDSVSNNKIWLARLEGDEAYLRSLTATYSDPKLHIFEEPEGFFVASSRLASATDKVKVYEVAKELTDFLNTSARLFCGRHNPLRLHGIWSRTGSERPTYEYLSASASSLTPLLVHVFSPKITPPLELYEVWVESARVRYVLDLYGSSAQLDWFCLYKLYETVRDDPMLGAGKQGIEAIVEWTSASDNKCFFDTANWYRHSEYGQSRGRENTQPAESMSLSEASRFIGKIVSSWITFQLSKSQAGLYDG